MKGFKSTSANPYEYIQSGVWKKGQYTFQAIVLSDSGYAIAFQKPDLSWDVIDLSWQVQAGQYCSVLEAGFTLEYDAVAFKLIANAVTGEVIVLSPMLEKGGNPSTPIAHEEDLRGMDGDNHEFIFTRNDTGIAPDTPLSTQDDDYVPEDWTDNAQGVTKELPFEFVSMRERKNGVWLDFSPPSLWAKWAEDGFNVKLHLQGHYVSHWEGTTKVTEIVGGEIINDSEVVKITAKIRKGEKDVTADELLSRGFIWYANGVEVARDVPFITLDETYGDGFADYVVLSYLVNSLREEEQVEVLNISAGMDGIGEEFIFKSNNSETEPPVLPQTTDTNYQDDDYYGQGTANEWSDDPVSPTEANQFVWTAKRKKVGGIWEAFGTPSVWTRWVTDGGDAAYWELHSSAPLIYKDAEDASTSGVHTTITLSGRYVKGVSSQNGGYISVQPNGGVEDTPLISPREFTPPNNAGVDEYVIRLYDDDSKATLLDTLTVPIAFKGDKGVSAINIILSNESDALPASPEGVVSDYSGSGTTIRVFEGNQELSYGTGNGKYQVVATGSNISPDSTPTTNGNARVYGNASNMGAAATAVITFTVSGKTFGGESFSFDKVQNFTKSERGDEGEDGEDGITIIPNQQGYTYRADLNGDIIGSLANGMVELTIMNGSTPITCSSTSGGVPTTNGTYRVTRTLGNGITTNQSLSDGKYRITPATLTVDEASVNLDIKIMMGGSVTSYPLILTYRKQFDGADGKSTEFIFKGHTSDNTAPTLPSTSQQDDWYGQGTANEWNDDLIEPTKSLPYVWASQRKKVDGVWGAFTTPKVWLRYAEDGDGITSTTIHYAKSSNGTTPPSDGWSTSLPEPTMGWYLWTRTTTTYKFAETTVSYSVSHWAEDGDAIVSTTIEYAKSSSGTVIPETWSTSLPTPTKGWYLWTRTTIEYKTSPTTVSYSISYWAEDGDDAVDIRLTATNTQAVIGTNGVTPAQITVTGTAKNTTISGWSYSVDGGSFTTPPNGVTRAGNVVTIDTAVAVWHTLAIKAYNTTDNVDSVITISIVGSGVAGKNGKVPIVKEWLSGDTHLNNDVVVDFIYYRPTGTWWKLKDAYTSRVASSSPSTTYYEQIPYMGALATKVLIAEEANLANFIFKDGKLISVRGTVNGGVVDYAGQAGFIPSVVIDGKTGNIIVQNDTTDGSVWTGTLSPNGLIFEVSYINGTYSPKTIWIAGSGAISITDQSDPNENKSTNIGSSSITVQRGSNQTAINPDGIYINGQKFTGEGGGYTHPSTHPASMISAGTLGGIVKANNNTSYTTKQVRNMILSTGDAVASSMENGDIWIKYE